MTNPTSHPRELYVLFFTEMWERFGFYLMVGILLLYLRDTTSHASPARDGPGSPALQSVE